MRRFLYDILGVLLLACSVYFFFQSVRFFSDRDYVAAILEIFVGLALTRSGLEVMKLGLISAGGLSDNRRGTDDDRFDAVPAPPSGPPPDTFARPATGSRQGVVSGGGASGERR